MDEHQTRKAAKEYAKRIVAGHEEESCEGDIIAIENSFADAFKAGIEWYINSMWHHPSEKPAPERMILVLFESGNLISWYSVHSIDAFLKMHKVSKWAYVDDLIIKDLI